MNGEDSPSTERSRNLWAPWRMEYIDTLTGGEGDDCFLCRYRDDPTDDAAHLVLWRGTRCLALMNRFPYTGGHAMVAPMAHHGTLDQLDDGTMLELMSMVRDVQKVLEHTIKAKGFNIGINVGRCAGAGLPGHLHVHIVPRWPGDTNFITVFGGVRVIPQALEKLYSQLRETAQALGLPAAARPDGR